MLSEVLFEPPADAAAFVELGNVSKAPADLTPLAVVVGATSVRLAQVGPTLGSGERILIKFDGGTTVDGLTIHAAPESAMPRTTGAVELVGAEGALIDRVAWAMTRTRSG